MTVFPEDAAVATIGQLREVGLGSYYTPVGMLQNAVEGMSATTGLPWVAGIVGTTILVRIFMLPVVFGSMRNNVKLMNIRPETELHTERLRACQSAGDTEGAALAGQNLNNLFKSHGCHPLKSFIPLVFQAPVFISFFMCLRKMAELPVPGMENGGMLWFTDLTQADPTYALPVLASVTMLATIELGSEGVQQQQQTMKMVFRGLSVAMIPMTASFPTAVLAYWVTSNVFSLSQVAMLKIPGLKTALDIPEQIKHPTPAGAPKKGFLEELKSGYKAQMDKAQLEQERAAKEKRLLAMANTKLPPAVESHTRAAASPAPTASATSRGGKGGKGGKKKGKRAKR